MAMINELSVGTLNAMPYSAATGEASRNAVPTNAVMGVPTAPVAAAKEQDLPPKAGKPSQDELEQAVTKANSFLQSVQRGLQFRIDKDTNVTVVKVVDSESGETVRQIPAEETLAMLKHLGEMESKLGALFKTSA
jgi:flagellar protein FlaG